MSDPHTRRPEGRLETSAPRPASSWFRRSTRTRTRSRASTPTARDETSNVDVMLVNPPTPDGGDLDPVAAPRRPPVAREHDLAAGVPRPAGGAAAARPTPCGSSMRYAERMTWAEFEQILRRERPRYYVTQLTAPTLQNDLYGTFLAKSVGATTMAFGTHITPMPRETLAPYPDARLRPARRAGPDAARPRRSPRRATSSTRPPNIDDAVPASTTPTYRPRHARGAGAGRSAGDLSVHEGPRLAHARRGGREPRPAVHRGSRRPADAAATTCCRSDST